MAEGAPKRRWGFLFIVLGVAAITAGFARMHGTPAFLSSMAGAALFVLGIAASFRK
jgi:hypothetical protein